MEGQQQYDETNLLDYLKVMWKHKRFVIFIIAFGVIGAAVASLFMKPVYEAKAVIIPAGVLSRDQGATTSFLAMQFGMAPPITPASVEIVNLLKSDVLREKLVRRYNLLPLFFTREQMRNKKENQLTWQGLRYLQGHMTVTFSQRDNLITVSFQCNDPDKAAQIVGYTLTELTDYMSSEAKRVADTNKRYLEAQLDSSADPFIKAKVYGLIAQQIETSVMAEVKENFAFKVLDPPRVPDRKIKPRPIQMVISAFVASLFMGIFSAFTLEYAQKLKRASKQS